jgi:hypothetical protein
MGACLVLRQRHDLRTPNVTACALLTLRHHLRTPKP